MSLGLPYAVPDLPSQGNFDFLALQFPLKAGAYEEGSIEGEDIAPETITGNLLVKGTITGDRIAAETITAGLIETGTLTATQIKAGTITGSLIAGETIEGSNIKAGALTAEKLSVSELSAISANLGSITAGAVTGATITGGLIRTAVSGSRVEQDSEGIRGLNVAEVAKFKFETATGLAYVTGVLSSEDGSEIPTKHLAGQIKETQIEEGAISTPLLAANAVTASEIKAGAVTATKLSVSELSAISANLGSITAGTITGGTITIIGSNPTEFNNNGLVIREGVVLGEAPSILEWRNSAGKITSEIFAVGNETESLLYSWAGRLKLREIAQNQMLVTNKSGVGANVTAFISSIESYIKATANAETKSVITGTGTSDFLQLTETAKRKVNRGTVELEFGGGSRESKTATVTHGIGSTPSAVVMTYKAVAAVDYMFWQVSVVGATTFACACKCDAATPANGTKVPFYWIAIG